MQSLIVMLMQLQKAGRFAPGQHISIENEPYMRLVIEYLYEQGPDGHPVVSVAHYGEQNGDAMCDPEMLFQVIGQGTYLALQPYYFRNDYIGVEEWSRQRQGDGHGQLVCNARLQREHATFAATWAQNLDDQGFPDALARALASPIAGA